MCYNYFELCSDGMRRRQVGCAPVAAGCWERPRLSLRLCCSMRVNMVVVAADSALAPYDITCTMRPHSCHCWLGCAMFIHFNSLLAMIL